MFLTNCRLRSENSQLDQCLIWVIQERSRLQRPDSTLLLRRWRNWNRIMAIGISTWRAEQWMVSTPTRTRRSASSCCSRPSQPPQTTESTSNRSSGTWSRDLPISTRTLRSDRARMPRSMSWRLWTRRPSWWSSWVSMRWRSCLRPKSYSTRHSWITDSSMLAPSWSPSLDSTSTNSMKSKHLKSWKCRWTTVYLSTSYCCVLWFSSRTLVPSSFINRSATSPLPIHPSLLRPGKLNLI